MYSALTFERGKVTPFGQRLWLERSVAATTTTSQCRCEARLVERRVKNPGSTSHSTATFLMQVPYRGKGVLFLLVKFSARRVTLIGALPHLLQGTRLLLA